MSTGGPRHRRAVLQRGLGRRGDTTLCGEESSLQRVRLLAVRLWFFPSGKRGLCHWLAMPRQAIHHSQHPNRSLGCTLMAWHWHWGCSLARLGLLKPDLWEPVPHGPSPGTRTPSQAVVSLAPELPTGANLQERLVSRCLFLAEGLAGESKPHCWS